MRDMKNWAWLLFFGSLWGLSEVMGGGFLYNNDVPHASVFLAAWAVFILAVARGIVNRPGSSLVIGAVATLFKLANASPYICHLRGIFMLGAAFDAAASLLGRRGARFSFRNVLTGIAGAYGGYASFALIITYIIRYDTWVQGGWPKVADHIFVGGSMAALLAAALVPLGYILGTNSGRLETRKPSWLYAGTVAAALLFWVLGRFSG